MGKCYLIMRQTVVGKQHKQQSSFPLQSSSSSCKFSVHRFSSWFSSSRNMSQLCASDNFSLPSDGEDRERHIGRKYLGQQRQRQIEHGYHKTHSTVGVLRLSSSLSLSHPLSLSLSLSLSLCVSWISCAKYTIPLTPTFSSSYFFFNSLPQDNGILLEFKRWLPLAVGKKRILAEATSKKAVHYMAGITYLLDPTSVDESKVLDASNVERRLDEVATNTGLGPSGLLARIDALIHFVRFLQYKAESTASLQSSSSSSSSGASSVQTLQFVLGQYRCIRTNREKDRKRQDNFVREQEVEADLDNEAVRQIVNVMEKCSG